MLEVNFRKVSVFEKGEIFTGKLKEKMDCQIHFGKNS